jgi:hypothetical protein
MDAVLMANFIALNEAVGWRLGFRCWALLVKVGEREQSVSS